VEAAVGLCCWGERDVRSRVKIERREKITNVMSTRKYMICVEGV
jgi:hypothetical protein